MFNGSWIHWFSSNKTGKWYIMNNSDFHGNFSWLIYSNMRSHFHRIWYKPIGFQSFWVWTLKHPPFFNFFEHTSGNGLVNSSDSANGIFGSILISSGILFIKYQQISSWFHSAQFSRSFIVSVIISESKQNKLGQDFPPKGSQS